MSTWKGLDVKENNRLAGIPQAEVNLQTVFVVYFQTLKYHP